MLRLLMRQVLSSSAERAKGWDSLGKRKQQFLKPTREDEVGKLYTMVHLELAGVGLSFNFQEFC